MDNAESGDCVTQLGLNDTEICEIALSVGPTFDQYTKSVSTLASRPPLSSAAYDRIVRKPSESVKRLIPSPSPALIPAHLRLLAVVEAFKSNRRLECECGGMIVTKRLPSACVLPYAFYWAAPTQPNPSQAKPPLLLFLLTYLPAAIWCIIHTVFAYCS